MEREFDEAHAERLAPAAFRAFAAAGTTTAVIYTAVYEPSTEVDVPRGRGARPARRHRQGDDGSAELRRPTGARRHPGDEPPPERRPVLALAWPGRWAPALRVHAQVRGLLFGRHAAGIGAPGGRDRCLLADPPVRGPRRAGRGRPTLPRGDRLPRRLRPGGRAGRAHDPGARHPLLRARGRSTRRVRLACRALPGLEPVPGLGRDAAGSLPRCGRVGRPGIRRRRRARAVDLRGHARRRLHAERPAGPRGAKHRRIACCVQRQRPSWRRRLRRHHSTGCVSGPWKARGRSGSTT